MEKVSLFEYIMFFGEYILCAVGRGAKFCLGAFNLLLRNDKKIRFVTRSFRAGILK